MARPQKKTVDYFPHIVTGSKKTLFILETKFGIQGYYFWFHLLELLAMSEGHYYDFNNLTNAEYLFSYTKTEQGVAENILNTLANLGAIDKELWEQKIIWSQNFVDGVKDAYKKRIDQLPQRPSYLLLKQPKPVVSGVGNPAEPTKSDTETGKEKESKVKESNYNVFFETIWDRYPKKKGKGQVSKTQKEKLQKIGLEKITRAIDRYKLEIQGKDQQYTQNGSTFFNSGYIDYLDENYQLPQENNSSTSEEDPDYQEWLQREAKPLADTS